MYGPSPVVRNMLYSSSCYNARHNYFLLQLEHPINSTYERKIPLPQRGNKRVDTILQYLIAREFKGIEWRVFWEVHRRALHRHTYDKC